MAIATRERIPLHELAPEPKRSSNRFRLINGKAPAIVDAKRDKKYYLESSLRRNKVVKKMVANLIATANERVGKFDLLLSAHENLGCVLKFLMEAFPELFESGLMQGLIDLDSIVHDLVVRRQPDMIVMRSKRFDGGFHRLESILTLLEQKKSVRIASQPPIRLHSDMAEARIVLAYRGLKAGREPADVASQTERLLKLYGIRRIDLKNSVGVKLIDVENWDKYVEDESKSLGRFYCWRYFKTKYVKELSSGNAADGLKFAEQIFNEVRWRQPTHHSENYEIEYAESTPVL